MQYNIILEIVYAFYAKAKIDILIGFHFRNIIDFDEHIPRIADFWQLQLTGKIDRKESLPFNLLLAHKPMTLLPGQLDRWVFLFEQTLNEKCKENIITIKDKEDWMKKVSHFRGKLNESSYP